MSTVSSPHSDKVPGSIRSPVRTPRASQAGSSGRGGAAGSRRSSIHTAKAKPTDSPASQNASTSNSVASPRSSQSNRIAGIQAASRMK